MKHRQALAATAPGLPLVTLPSIGKRGRETVFPNPEILKEQDMKLVHIIAAATFAMASLGSHAQSASASAAANAAPQSEGEVRKIDKDQAKVTLRHGPLQNLDMPAMTMVFKAADPKLLEGLKEGDKVRFTAARVNGAIAVTVIQVVK